MMHECVEGKIQIAFKLKVRPFLSLPYAELAYERFLEVYSHCELECCKRLGHIDHAYSSIQEDRPRIILDVTPRG
jgi:hypothetical protein